MKAKRLVLILALPLCMASFCEGSGTNSDTNTRCQRAAEAVQADPNNPAKQQEYERAC